MTTLVRLWLWRMLCNQYCCINVDGCLSVCGYSLAKQKWWVSDRKSCTDMSARRWLAVWIGSNVWYDQRGYHEVVKRKQYASQCVTVYADLYSSMTATMAFKSTQTLPQGSWYVAITMYCQILLQCADAVLWQCKWIHGYQWWYNSILTMLQSCALMSHHSKCRS